MAKAVPKKLTGLFFARHTTIFISIAAVKTIIKPVSTVHITDRTFFAGFFSLLTFFTRPFNRSQLLTHHAPGFCLFLFFRKLLLQFCKLALSAFRHSLRALDFFPLQFQKQLAPAHALLLSLYFPALFGNRCRREPRGQTQMFYLLFQPYPRR